MKLLDKMRQQKLLSMTLLLFTLSIGIVIGTLVNTGVHAQRQAGGGRGHAVAASGAAAGGGDAPSAGGPARGSSQPPGQLEHSFLCRAA